LGGNAGGGGGGVLRRKARRKRHAWKFHHEALSGMVWGKSTHGQGGKKKIKDACMSEKTRGGMMSHKAASEQRQENLIGGGCLGKKTQGKKGWIVASISRLISVAKKRRGVGNCLF